MKKPCKCGQTKVAVDVVGEDCSQGILGKVCFPSQRFLPRESDIVKDSSSAHPQPLQVCSYSIPPREVSSIGQLHCVPVTPTVNLRNWRPAEGPSTFLPLAYLFKNPSAFSFPDISHAFFLPFLLREALAPHYRILPSLELSGELGPL